MRIVVLGAGESGAGAAVLAKVCLLYTSECNGEAQPGKYPVLGWQTDGKFAARI